jgi:hypothetical protein
VFPLHLKHLEKAFQKLQLEKMNSLQASLKVLEEIF